MKKRFIVLVDFSEHSANLIQYAYDWSKLVDAKLLLYHKTTIVSPALADNETRHSIAQMINEKALDKLKTLSKSTLPENANVQYSVSETNLLLSLQNFLEEPFEHLIFTGMKGTGFLKKIFLGSTTIQIIENINNLMVAIPKDISSFSPIDLYVAVSENHPLNILELNRLLNFTGGKSKKITFFYFAKDNEETLGMEKQLRDLTLLFGEKYITDFEIYQGTDAFEKIKLVINNKTKELLVIQKGSREWTDQLFRKFMINELVYAGETPLVILP
ncbi:hypothetical protein P872_19590 [Rhodonellum psychrophilum GCM71 = DSM 17998]|uniref:UspA domain-containing protein n=2 Tax=Rhodonellum TaxID=336827 RepID=U5C0J1_9BACT|nr:MULTISPECIES: universal stress protein [Rhodonellum]ERM81702.1 hypothetical protein P872_19590 [Rhodonellum psychrophilum GCM71 = DSM 17998]MDO9554777.1 universal stress protein [Rhodonellum sp.]SDY83557.1 Nucleotide-binding universal stress protein, UspA family [Rhodonellum ikkaensis]